MVYIYWLLSVVFAALGLAHFEVFSLSDMLGVAWIWCSGYLMSWVFNPARHHI